jgi:hypothetical protein
MNQSKTDFLVASSSFWMGVGSVLNLRGHLHDYNTSDHPDAIAIANDWSVIGQDIRNAMDRMNAEIETAKRSTVAHEREQAA